MSINSVQECVHFLKKNYTAETTEWADDYLGRNMWFETSAANDTAGKKIINRKMSSYNVG